MTTPTATATTTAATTTTATDEMLNAIVAGQGIPTSVYAEGAVLDATVPGWHFQVEGADAITEEYGRWFADAGRFAGLERRPTADGEVVSYVLTWHERGELHAASHCHIITLAPDGRIARDAVWCGGRWGAALLAEMGATTHA